LLRSDCPQILWNVLERALALDPADRYPSIATMLRELDRHVSVRPVLIAPEGTEQEVATRFARIGFDNVVGYLPDPQAYFLSHQAEVEQASRLGAHAADEAVDDADVQVVDIRNAGEVVAGMVPGARHIPLAELATRATELDPDRPVLLYCAGGWRSSVAASLLRAKGFADVSDILGGYGAWVLTHPRAS